jgi:hypothetical protein
VHVQDEDDPVWHQVLRDFAKHSNPYLARFAAAELAEAGGLLHTSSNGSNSVVHSCDSSTVKVTTSKADQVAER